MFRQNREAGSLELEIDLRVWLHIRHNLLCSPPSRFNNQGFQQGVKIARITVLRLQQKVHMGAGQFGGLMYLTYPRPACFIIFTNTRKNMARWTD
jgi:hypothetical protein